MQQSARMPAPGSFRSAVRLTFPILAAFNLTCAHPAAPGGRRPPGARSRGGRAASDDGTLAPLPARAEADPDDGAHRAARARQDDRASRRSRFRDAGRVDGASTCAATASAWTPAPTCASRARRIRAGRGRRGSPACPSATRTTTAARANGGLAGHPTAAARARRAPDRARLPPAGVQRRARALSLRAARRRSARRPIRARCSSGPTVSRTTSRGSAWGEFATARVRELYPEPAPKAVAEPADPRDRRARQEGSSAGAKAKGSRAHEAAKAAPGGARTRRRA